MSDFFGNLILRSAGGQPSSVILKPRLPSLFEPPGAPDQVGSPVEQPFAPVPVQAAGEATPARPQSGLSMVRADTLRSPEEAPRPADQAAGPLPVRADMPPALVEEQPVAAPADDVPESASSTIHRLWQRPPFPARESFQPVWAEPVAPGRQQAAEALPPNQPAMEFAGTKPDPLDEGSPVEQRDYQRAAARATRTGSKALSLSPSRPAVRHRLAREQMEQAQEHAQQHVVQIHIGRIEVRAASAPGSQQAQPRASTIMTLDEYLQHRKAGDHR